MVFASLVSHVWPTFFDGAWYLCPLVSHVWPTFRDGAWYLCHPLVPQLHMILDLEKNLMAVTYQSGVTKYVATAMLQFLVRMILRL